MAWGLTIFHLYRYVFEKALVEFNTAQKKYSSKLTPISRIEDFLDLREGLFIEIAGSAGIITKVQKKLLLEKLGLRNDLAHPSARVASPSVVTATIDELLQNIVLKF